MRLPGLLLTLSIAACASGCTEVDEHLVLDGRNGGTYTLRLRWNADVWRRATEHLPAVVRARLEAHPVPLREAAWRDSLEGRDGLELLSLESGIDSDGWRELAVAVEFRHLRDLLRWELFARRSLKLRIEPDGDGEDAPRVARLTMDPIPFVPVLDPVAALVEAAETPPPAAEGLRAHRDPPPLRRFGLDSEEAGALWRFVGPQVDTARLTFRVTVPGALRSVGGVSASGQEARRTFGFADLRDPDADRRVACAWRVRAIDDPQPIAHEGEDRAQIVAAARSR